MTMRKKHIGWMVVAFFVAIIAVVFQQIYTSMTEQGIASGGPYDNAAAYPAAVAILIGILVLLQAGLGLLRALPPSDEENEAISLARLKRPAGLLLIFGIYLALLGPLGYHLTTAPMIFAVMVLCGMRIALVTIAVSVVIAFVLAFAFEVFLKVVLPGGIFALNIPW